MVPAMKATVPAKEILNKNPAIVCDLSFVMSVIFIMFAHLGNVSWLTIGWIFTVYRAMYSI